MLVNRIVMLCAAAVSAALLFSIPRVRAADDQASAALYSAAQAKRGADLYQSKQCALCHGAGLKGQGSFPALSGDNFVSVYSGQPLAGVYDKIQKQMPPTAPGSLTPQEASDILAYILSVNKYPAGPTDLPSDRDKLKTLTLPKPAN